MKLSVFVKEGRPCPNLSAWFDFFVMAGLLRYGTPCDNYHWWKETFQADVKASVLEIVASLKKVFNGKCSSLFSSLLVDVTATCHKWRTRNLGDTFALRKVRYTRDLDIILHARLCDSCLSWRSCCILFWITFPRCTFMTYTWCDKCEQIFAM